MESSKARTRVEFRVVDAVGLAIGLGSFDVALSLLRNIESNPPNDWQLPSRLQRREVSMVVTTTEWEDVPEGGEHRG